MSSAAEKAQLGIKRLVERAFPWIARDHRPRYSLRAAVLGVVGSDAIVQPMRRDESGDTDMPPMTLALPIYCKSLGPGSVVRVAFDYADSGHAYIADIISAVLPEWQFANDTNSLQVNTAGVLIASPNIQQGSEAAAQAAVLGTVFLAVLKVALSDTPAVNGSPLMTPVAFDDAFNPTLSAKIKQE